MIDGCRVIYTLCPDMAGNRSRFSKHKMIGSQIFLINLTNRRIPANPNYHMSIKKTQAILKCLIHLKSSAWFTRASENETMFCDTWNLFIRSCLHFAACGRCCVVHRTEKIRMFYSCRNNFATAFSTQ